MKNFLLVSLIASALLFFCPETEANEPNMTQAEARAMALAKKTATPSQYVGLHPYFALENIDTVGGELLRISAMAFHGEDLYVTTMTPDRTDKAPFKAGKLLRIENALKVGEPGEALKVTTLRDDLYEPAAIAVVGDSLYVGEKDRIIRLNDGVHQDAFAKGDEVVLLDGLSSPNFHTYTVGFEQYEKDGGTYLAANLTTAVRLGGKRDVMVPPNPEIHRGSTIVFGPVTGSEAPESMTHEFIAGGFRTPNGIEVGPDNEIWVADNQGIFNPSNELIRLEPGSFYGHYLITENGRAAAFQPKEFDPEVGSAWGQSPATIHLPQGLVARSPAQPIVLREETGLLKPYNGHILLCEFTSGRLLRVFTEKVDGVWQGAVFQHSGGPADENGENGFTAGPNRIEQGPDGNFYIGQIGVGGLWTYNGTWQGLQRLRVKSPDEAPTDFNEILAVRVVEGGFELEFLKPIPQDSISLEQIKVAQWTYFPTASYGGAEEAKVQLKPRELKFDPSGTKATLIINGLKDGSPEYTISKGAKSNANTGWVVHVQFDPKEADHSLLRANEFWYTLHKKIGGEAAGTGDIMQLTKAQQIEGIFQNLCLSCHVERDGGWAAPDFANILGRKQKVLRDGEEVEVVVDRDYIINSILYPDSEKTLPYKDLVMPPLGLPREDAEDLADYLLSQ